MPSLNTISTYIPSGAELERAAKAAMENIDRQLKKMPPVKKTPTAADHFPGLYDNPGNFKIHVLGQKDENHRAIIKHLAADRAINAYRNVG